MVSQRLTRARHVERFENTGFTIDGFRCELAELFAVHILRSHVELLQIFEESGLLHGLLEAVVQCLNHLLRSSFGGGEAPRRRLYHIDTDFAQCRYAGKTLDPLVRPDHQQAHLARLDIRYPG